MQGLQLRGLAERIRDIPFRFIDDIDRPFVDASTSPFVRPWERDRVEAALRFGAASGAASVITAGAAIPLAFLRRDTREVLRRHWKWFIPAQLLGKFALGAGVAYFTAWRDEVNRIERALEQITGVLDAPTVEVAAEQVANLIALVSDADSVTILVRANGEPGSLIFKPIASHGEPVIGEALELQELDEEELISSAQEHGVVVLERLSPGLGAVLLHDGSSVFGIAVTDNPQFIGPQRVLPTVQRSAAAIIARFAAVSQLRAAAIADPLTGLYNRRYFDDALSRLQPGEAVVMIDLDHFKHVNDTHGHSAGDEVLRDLARRLLRLSGANDCPARYGGEEFALIVRPSRGWRARALIEGLARDWRADSPVTTFSAGIGEHEFGSAERTLEVADRALYEAKASGRDRIVTGPRMDAGGV